MSSQRCSYPVVSVVDFNHARGPEVECWVGVENESDISDWPLLPFLALADGAHSTEEDFSYFTLKHDRVQPPITLFGISCTRQLDSRELLDRPPEVTRSTVQKAVVVVADTPTHFFGHLKQQLSVVTQAWFAQKNFGDLDIIRRFQESLKASLLVTDEREQYVGLSLREIIHEFKYNTLVLFKCMLLQPKMLFFGSRCERLCMVQFSLLSLIPGLLRNLQDSGDPEMSSYENTLTKPTSVRTSDRNSLLAFMGLPLQIFGEGSLFGPYTPLQQLDILADVGTKSYIVGSTNLLLLQQKDRYSDILINLDEGTVNITSSSLRAALSLSAADRRWADGITQIVVDSWDENDPSRPKNMGYLGSEDHIRLQFEEYLLAMVSSVKYHLFLQKHSGAGPTMFRPDIEGDPSVDFNPEFVHYWMRTENFRIFNKFTDSEIFDIVIPRHPMAGGLSMEDVQRRLAQQVQELHLDEKARAGREAAAKALAAGRSNLSLAFMNISKNVEKFREQRRSQDSLQPTRDVQPDKSPASSTPTSPILGDAPSKASAYLSSWASWAGEKRKKAFGGTTSPPPEKMSNDGEQVSQPSIFSRWSKSSNDLPATAVEDERPRGTTSVEVMRETVWENNRAHKELPPGEEKVRLNIPEPEKPGTPASETKDDLASGERGIEDSSDSPKTVREVRQASWTAQPPIDQMAESESATASINDDLTRLSEDPLGKPPIGQPETIAEPHSVTPEAGEPTQKPSHSNEAPSATKPLASEQRRASAAAIRKMFEAETDNHPQARKMPEPLSVSSRRSPDLGSTERNLEPGTKSPSSPVKRAAPKALAKFEKNSEKSEGEALPPSPRSPGPRSSLPPKRNSGSSAFAARRAMFEKK